MLRKRRPSLWLLIALCCSTSIFHVATGYAGQDEKAQADPAQAEQLKQRVRLWQSVFGAIDFKPGNTLFDVLIYAGPQPLQSMSKLGDKKLSRRLIRADAKWLRTFLRLNFKADQVKLPTYYWLSNTEENAPLPDLLFYEVNNGKNKISWFDNANLMLFMIKPPDYDSRKGVTAEQLSRLLLNTLNLPAYRTPGDVAAAFSLPPVLHVGDTFLNSGRKRLQPVMVSNWRDNVFGFIGENGVNIVCFKCLPDPPGTLRAKMWSFDWKPYWLAGQLLEKDGVTPVPRTAP